MSPNREEPGELDAPPTAETIRDAYRLFLGRVPSDSEVSHWARIPSVAELRNRFLASDEFAIKVRQLPIPNRIGPTAPRIRVDWRADAATEAHLLEHVRRTWIALGQEKAHWSVLSADQFLPDRIEKNREAFYRSGDGLVATLVATLARQGIAPDQLPHVVEFGCGVGRVTPHLAARFTAVTATDISHPHLEMAKAVTKSPNVHFALTELPDFGIPDGCDLWFSYIVLQHNPPPVMALILRRAFEALRPGGMAVFQVPVYASRYAFDLADYLRRPPSTEIEMHCLPQSVVFALAAEAGCVPLEVREDNAIPTPGWVSYLFALQRMG